MLMETKMNSVNQILGYSMVIETWKARNFNVPVLASLFERERSDGRTLRSDTGSQVLASFNETFSRGAATLWNMSSHSLKSTNLLIIAKAEARKLAKSLPL